jgi:hypothetical protein
VDTLDRIGIASLIDVRQFFEPMSEMGHSRPGRASRKSGRVRYASKAEVISEHERLRDRPLRLMVRLWT